MKSAETPKCLISLTTDPTETAFYPNILKCISPSNLSVRYANSYAWTAICSMKYPYHWTK